MELLRPQLLQLHMHLLKSADGTTAHGQSPSTTGLLQIYPHMRLELVFAKEQLSTSARAFLSVYGARLQVTSQK